jgi:hypothetical protein
MVFRRFALALGILGLAVVRVSAEGPTRTVTVYDGRVTLSIPSDWNEIPADILEFYSLRAAESSGGRNAEFYQYGFRPGDPEVGFSLPQILIQIRESGRLKYGDFLSLPPVESMRKDNAWRLNERKGPLVKGVRFEGAVYDRKTHSLHVRNTIDLKLEGKTAVESVSFLTENGLFTIHCYASIPQFTQTAPVFADIIASVRLDDSLRYRPRLSDRWPPRPSEIAFVAAAVTVSVFLLVYVLRRGRQQ